jgi:hypothetical protein
MTVLCRRRISPSRCLGKGPSLLGGPGYNRLKATLTPEVADLRVIKVEGSGHFIAEEKPEARAQAPQQAGTPPNERLKGHEVTFSEARQHKFVTQISETTRRQARLFELRPFVDPAQQKEA